MPSEPGNQGDKPLYTPRLLVLGAALVGVLMLAFVAVVTHRGPASAAAAPPASRPPASRPPALQPSVGAQAGGPAPGSSASPAGATAACNVPPGDNEIPTSAPAGVTWQLYQTIALPFSAQAGPTVVSGDVARCYAHSPTGALLATVQIYIRLGVATDWRPVVDAQVLAGPGRNVFAAERPDESVTVQPGEFGQVAGFQFVTYTGSVAVIQLVVQMPDGSLQMAAMTSVWNGGDWRLELQPDGQASANIQQLSSLAGFVPWGGV